MGKRLGAGFGLAVVAVFAVQAAPPVRRAHADGLGACSDTKENLCKANPGYCGPGQVTCSSGGGCGDHAEEGVVDLTCACPADSPKCLGDKRCHGDFEVKFVLTGGGAGAKDGPIDLVAPATSCAGANVLVVEIGEDPFGLNGYDGQKFTWNLPGGGQGNITAANGDVLYQGVDPNLIPGGSLDIDDAAPLVYQAASPNVQGTLTITGTVGCPASVVDTSGAPSATSPTPTSSGTGTTPSPTGTTTGTTPPTNCQPLTLAFFTPAQGPQGSTVKITGSGFDCLDDLVFFTFSDLHTYTKDEIHVIDDANIEVPIPTIDDGGKPIELDDNCAERVKATSTDQQQSTAYSATGFSVTGTGKPNCPP